VYLDDIGVLLLALRTMRTSTRSADAERLSGNNYAP
jgi:hypothetical protein